MKRILTGDRPTGPLHIGHYFGSLIERVRLQNLYETYILIADVQALTDNFNNPEKVRDNILEVVKDYLASGIDPKKATIVIQSKMPAIAELTVFYSNLVTMSRLSRNPTVKEEVKQKKSLFGESGESLTYGFFGYPVSQAADILSFNAHLVPVGEDQLPMIELTREIARKFNSIYGEVFVIPEAKIGKIGRIKGLDGNTKMGKSQNNAIYLKDDEKTLEQKVMKAFTDPKKIRKNDPGHPEGCMVYYYHKIFTFALTLNNITNQNNDISFNPDSEENLPDEIINLKNECKAGKRGCVYCKKELIKKMNNFLYPIRNKRIQLENQTDFLKDVLNNGIKKGLEITTEVLYKAKSAMKIDYKEILF